MKKTILLIIAILITLSTFAQKKEKGGQIHDLGSGIFVMAVSPNGEYVTGYEINGSFAILWTDDGTSVLQPDGGCTAYSVSDNGTVVGQFYDPEIQYLDYDGMIQYVHSAGYCPKDGNWIGLGVKDEILVLDYPSEFGSMAEAISADGNIIGGSMYYPSWTLEPTIWTNGTPAALEVELIGQGGRLQAMSSDGTVAAGWVAPYYDRLPAVWINGELTIMKIDGIIQSGEGSGVSPNGKYVCFNSGGTGYLYDTEEDNIITIGSTSVPTGVSNDGIVIGYDQVGWVFEREPFIFTEKMGKVNLNAYLVSAGVAGASSAEIECPMDISADGTRIVGFSSNLSGFVIDVEHIDMDGFYAPSKLSAVEDTYQEIILSWTAAKDDANNTLNGYNIYRNGSKINTSVVSNTNFTDVLTSNGSYKYYVTAVWNNTEESASTNEIEINSGIIPVPFLENFNTLNFTKNFWTKSAGSEFFWLISEYNGVIPPCLNYSGPSGTYSNTLYSAFIDATEKSQVFLSFNLALPTAELGTDTDKFKIEVYDGTSWQLVEEFTPTFGYSSFSYYKYDISEHVADKITRIKFTGYGNSIGESLFWLVDNINVFTPEDALVIEAPLRVTASKSTDGTVHINWADPNRLAELSYLANDYLVDGIGNEGIPFIAANKFEANDLKGYDNYYLTSISAYITGAMNVSSKLSLAVFLGNERIVDQPINSYEEYAWNTFELSEPIFISKDIDKDLYFGIEVVTHQDGDLPLGVCERPYLDWDPVEEKPIYAYQGRSNITSIDNGQTWTPMTVFDLDYYSCAVKAHLIGAANPYPKERLMGYSVYRDGVNILGEDWLGNKNLTPLHNFTDTTSNVNDDACYQVTAYYDTQQESDQLEFCLGDEIAGVNNTINAVNQYTIYPNPTNSIINIDGEFIDATVYSIDGRKLINTTSNLINLNNYPNGMYLIKIISKDNTIETQKIIKY